MNKQGKRRTQNQENRYICDDSKHIDDYIEGSSVDLVLTSPPYWDQKNYTCTEREIGYGQSFDEYVASLVEIFEKLHGIVKNTGSLWIIADTIRRKKETINLPSIISDIAKSKQWLLQDIIIWQKDRTTPWYNKGQFKDIFEYILFFTKSEDYKFYIDRLKEPGNLKEWWVKYPERYNPRGKSPSSIWDFPIPVQGSWANTYIKHACPFPPRLVERIIALTTDEDDLVLDPFAGSGVVLGQAHCMKRRYIGFDISQEFVDSFYDLVLPELINRWESSTDTIKTMEKERALLEKKIKKLRLIKYPKMLYKGLPDDMKPLVDYIVVISDLKIDKKVHSHNDAHILMDADIYFAIKHEWRDCELWKELLAESAKGKYVRKFGIRPSFSITTHKELKRKGRLKKMYPFYLYTDGKTYHYESEVELVNFLSFFEDNLEHHDNKYPPIISNQGIREMPRSID